MKNTDLLPINLRLFDGGDAGGDGAGTAAAQSGEGTQGEIPASPGRTHRGKKSGEFSTVLFGKQANAPTEDGQQAQSSAAGSDKTAQPPQLGEASTGDAPASSTLEERRRSFQELVNGEYKDIFTEETQRMIDRRFRETKSLEQQLGENQPVIDLLMQRYKIADGDVSKLSAALENDDAYWSEAAEEAGMEVAQYKQFQKLQRENAALLDAQRKAQGQQAAQSQLQSWYTQGEQLRGTYPDFDLAEESKNPQFAAMLRAGIPVQHAYEVLHMEDIKAGVAQSTARQTQKQVVEGIRAKGNRPAENGTSSQSAFTVKDDPSRWSKQDRQEVARRVARGETIKL